MAKKEIKENETKLETAKKSEESKEEKIVVSEVAPEQVKSESEKYEMTKSSGKSYIAVYALIVIAVGLIGFNQYQMMSVTGSFGSVTGFVTGAKVSGSGDKTLASVDASKITSTAQGIAALFPLEGATDQEVINIMIPTGTPDYGEAMGASFDDPINSMNALARAYPALKAQAQQDPALWQRYLSLAAAPRGIACEFCCGVGAQGIDSKGNLRCGCQHNPAIQAVTIWLMQNTDYNDAQILKEVYRWKSLWFPKNMVGIASQIAGGDSSVLQQLPGMVGGC